VARQLGLSSEDETRIVTAYVSTRGELIEALRAARQRARSESGEEGDQTREGGASNRELTVARREALEGKLAGFLEPEQATKAMAVLGTFSQSWDRMVDAIDRMELDEARAAAALDHVQVYIADTAALRRTGERSELREAYRSLRQKMYEGLGSLLDEQQMAMFRQAQTGRATRRGGSFERRLRGMDANGDGKVQKSEVPEQMHRVFDRCDTNGDGELDDGELRAADRSRGEPAGADG
jgi:hypothetical protein